MAAWSVGGLIIGHLFDVFLSEISHIAPCLRLGGCLRSLSLLLWSVVISLL